MDNQDLERELEENRAELRREIIQLASDLDTIGKRYAGFLHSVDGIEPSALSQRQRVTLTRYNRNKNILSSRLMRRVVMLLAGGGELPEGFTLGLQYTEEALKNG